MLKMSILLKNLSLLSGSADVDTILEPITNVKTLIFAVISLIGLIILGLNISEFVESRQNHQGGNTSKQVWGIVVGALMFGISGVVAFVVS